MASREFAATTDQSCLNRFLTEAPWEVDRINAHRLEWLQHDPTTRYRQDGGIAIDTSLIDHAGKLIDDVGYFWDYADKRHLIGHDYVFANSVTPSGKHSPLDFRRFRKRDQCTDDQPFKNHTDLARELIDAEAKEPRKILITNRTFWEAHHILKVYKRRWTGTETLHRDGKQPVGMGACQLRDGMGQTLSLAPRRVSVHRRSWF